MTMNYALCLVLENIVFLWNNISGFDATNFSRSSFITVGVYETIETRNLAAFALKNTKRKKEYRNH